MSALAVEAVPITGTFSYRGMTATRSPDLRHGMVFSFTPDGLMVSATGSFAGIGDAAAYAPGFTGVPFTVAPLSAAVPIEGLWTDGAFTFDVLTGTVDTRSTSRLTASGSGLMTSAGFDPTPGTWTLAITGNGSVLFGFDAKPLATVIPDSGSSAVLLAVGLLGLLGVGRRSGP